MKRMNISSTDLNELINVDNGLRTSSNLLKRVENSLIDLNSRLRKVRKLRSSAFLTSDSLQYSDNSSLGYRKRSCKEISDSLVRVKARIADHKATRNSSLSGHQDVVLLAKKCLSKVSALMNGKRVNRARLSFESSEGFSTAISSCSSGVSSSKDPLHVRVDRLMGSLRAKQDIYNNKSSRIGAEYQVQIGETPAKQKLIHAPHKVKYNQVFNAKKAVSRLGHGTRFAHNAWRTVDKLLKQFTDPQKKVFTFRMIDVLQLLHEQHYNIMETQKILQQCQSQYFVNTLQDFPREVLNRLPEFIEYKKNLVAEEESVSVSSGGLSGHGGNDSQGSVGMSSRVGMNSHSSKGGGDAEAEAEKNKSSTDNSGKTKTKSDSDDSKSIDDSKTKTNSDNSKTKTNSDNSKTKTKPKPMRSTRSSSKEKEKLRVDQAFSVIDLSQFLKKRERVIGTDTSTPWTPSEERAFARAIGCHGRNFFHVAREMILLQALQRPSSERNSKPNAEKELKEQEEEKNTKQDEAVSSSSSSSSSSSTAQPNTSQPNTSQPNTAQPSTSQPSTSQSNTSQLSRTTKDPSSRTTKEVIAFYYRKFKFTSAYTKWKREMRRSAKRIKRYEESTFTTASEFHNDRCEICEDGGDLLCCDTCNLVYHVRCLPQLKGEVPDGLWSCPQCVAELGKDTWEMEEAVKIVKDVCANWSPSKAAKRRKRERGMGVSMRQLKQNKANQLRLDSMDKASLRSFI